MNASDSDETRLLTAAFMVRRHGSEGNRLGRQLFWIAVNFRSRYANIFFAQVNAEDVIHLGYATARQHKTGILANQAKNCSQAPFRAEHSTKNCQMRSVIGALYWCGTPGKSVIRTGNRSSENVPHALQTSANSSSSRNAWRYLYVGPRLSSREPVTRYSGI